MIKITKDNYHSADNKFLSSSKMRDYDKSPEYFYNKHILRTIPSLQTEAIIRGSLVDVLLTGSKSEMEKRFRVVERRNLKNPPIGYLEINQSQYDEAEKIASKIKKTPAWKELKGHERQAILFCDKPVGRFPGFGGMLDFLYVNRDIAIITDLKTSSVIEPKKYYYHALDLNYDMQLAVYEDLVRYNFPEVKEDICRHLVVETDKDEIYKVQTFQFHDSLIEMGRVKYKEILKKIAKEKTYKDEPASFSKAVVLFEGGVAKQDNLNI